MEKITYLNDSIHGLISLSEYEKRIISSVGFNRMHDVYQNSTVYLTFPTNRTKRFEHSVGTLKLCSDMFFSSVLNASEDDLNSFYEMFEREYTKIINYLQKEMTLCENKLGGNRPKEFPEIIFDKFRHSLTPNNVPKKYQSIHLILIESIRVAALLHDIGHPPFSHVVEYALKEVYEENIIKKNNDQTEKMKKFLEKMSKYFGDNKKLHEQMGDEISKSILQSMIKTIGDEDSRFDENLHEILISITVEKIFTNQEKFSALHKIIDSSMDGDRLDYVTRDSINSGMNSGRIDYNRIINDMKLIIYQDDVYFCVPLKTVNSIEDFIKRRYNIYKEIINHHRVIKTDTLLQDSVKELVTVYLDNPLTENADDKSVHIPFDISGLWFPLGDSTTSEKANALSQWNDSWLMTVLKQIYYTDYYSKKGVDEGTDKYKLKKKLAELLRNEKNYYSFIKRGENFKIIDDEVKNVLFYARKEVEELVERLNKISEKCKDNEKHTTLDLKGTLDFIEGSMNFINNKDKGFLMSFISRRYKAIKIRDFEEFIKEIIDDVTKKVFTNIKYDDIMYSFKKISLGVKEPIYFYDESNKIYTLDDISGVSDILKLDSDYLPVFYIYIMVREGKEITIDLREKFLRSIGTAIGNKIKELVEIILQNNIKVMEESQCVK